TGESLRFAGRIVATRLDDHAAGGDSAAAAHALEAAGTPETMFVVAQGGLAALRAEEVHGHGPKREIRDFKRAPAFGTSRLGQAEERVTALRTVHHASGTR